MKIVRKIFKYIALLLIVFLLVAVLPVLFFRQAINTTPLALDYKKGVYHVHSTFSDGSGSAAEIVQAAAELDLDFVILTDHGKPNLESANATNWKDGVLLIGGSEFSLNCGHLAAMGFKVPTYIFPPEPQEAIAEVTADKGVSFISHPFDRKIPWSDWEIDGFTGIEVLSASSAAMKLNILQALIFPVQYLFNPDYALLNIIAYPGQNIEKWHDLNRSRSGNYFGIYALDAHGEYNNLFRILTVYVKIERELSQDANEAANAVIQAIRKGNFFNVIEAIAPANGFRARFIQRDGRIVEMGGRAKTSQGTIRLKLPFIFQTDIIVKRDGQTFQEILNNTSRVLDLKVYEPGVYSLELYVTNSRFNDIPWIMTNPFFINLPYPRTQKSQQGIGAPKKRLALAHKDFFSIETNPGSMARLGYETNKNNETIAKFEFHLQKDADKKDFWACLAKRAPFDFSGFKGMLFDARSSKKLRYWLELRTTDQGKETWYSHSFLADTKWRRIAIPFDRFHLAYGKKAMPDLAKISSIFFSINNGLAYPDTSATLELKNLALY